MSAPGHEDLRARVAALDAGDRRALARRLAAARDRERRFPLTADQERMWRMEQGRPPAATHVVAAGTRMVGPLDVAALRRAVTDVVARHDALRTRIVVEGGTPAQEVMPETDVALELIDLSGVAPGEREAALDRALCEVATRPFAYDGTLTRLPLVKLTDTEHVLGVVQHHIVSDWISFGTLTDELLACYGARLAGRTPALPPPSRQYVNWVRQERRDRDEGRLDAALEAIAARLAGVDDPITLRYDRQPTTRTFGGERQWMLLPEEAGRALHALAREHRGSLFMVVLAVLDQLLAERTGRDDVVVGAPTANRRSAPEDLLGLLLNYLVLRSEVPAGDLGALIPRVRTATLDALDTAHVPFADVVQRVAPQRALEYDALYRVRYLFLHWPAPRSVSGLALSPYDIDPRRSLYDVTVSFWDGPLGLFGRFEHRTDAYDAASVRDAMEHFGALLCAAAGVDAPSGAFVVDDAAMLDYFNRMAVG